MEEDGQLSKWTNSAVFSGIKCYEENEAEKKKDPE